MIRTPDSGTALVGSLILSLSVAAMIAGYLLTSTSEVMEARIPAARTHALYDVLGRMASARLLINRSRYDANGRNEVLCTAEGGTLPGLDVRVISMASSPDDLSGIYYTLEATAVHEGVRVTAQQLVAERESFSAFLTMVGDSDVGITGIEDPGYDPDQPAVAPPAPLSRGKIHSNKNMKLTHAGYRHYVNPVSSSNPDGEWDLNTGVEEKNQIFWFRENSKPGVRPVQLPDLEAFSEVRNLMMINPEPVEFPDSWASGIMTRNERGYHISGAVNVLVEFEGVSGTFSLTLRRQEAPNDTSTLTGLTIPEGAGILFVENGFDEQNPVSSPNQTVHLKGHLAGRLTVFASTGNARIAGSIKYVDSGGRPAAVVNPDGEYVENPDYRGSSALGIISEFDIRLGVRPNTTVWSSTQQHIDAVTGEWVSTFEPGLKDSPVGPSGETTPIEENLFGYLGGPSGSQDAEVQAALFARQGRLYADGMNPIGYTSDSWAYRIAWKTSGFVTPYGRPDSALYRFGSLTCNRRPITHLEDTAGNCLVGWGQGQSVFDESLIVNPPPYFFRHSQPVFHDIHVVDSILGQPGMRF